MGEDGIEPIGKEDRVENGIDHSNELKASFDLTQVPDLVDSLQFFKYHGLMPNHVVGDEELEADVGEHQQVEHVATVEVV